MRELSVSQWATMVQIREDVCRIIEDEAYAQDACDKICAFIEERFMNREYRPHPNTSMTVRINNAMNKLNIKRPDIAALPDGAVISRNITDDRNIYALLGDILTLLEGEKP